MSTFKFFIFAAGAAVTICVAAQIAAAADAAQQPGNSAAPAQAQRHWARDEQSGCNAPDPDFAQGDAIVWTGACVFGVVSGPGTLTFINKGQPQVTISGTFHQGSLQPGRATLSWPDGSKYDGEQLNGQFNGDGLFVSAAGDKLQGQWKNGKLNGHGTVNWINGNRYDGELRDGKAEGKGVEVWTNGDRYDGEWHDGKAQGYGEQDWANGQRYVGEWANDQPNGTGELVRSDGVKIDGVFVDGHPKAAATVAAAANASAPPAAPASVLATPASISAPNGSSTPAAAPNAHLGDLEGKKLLAIDGSSIALSASEGGFTREITRADGHSSTIAFAFLNDRQGTVADADSTGNVIGLFHMTDQEIDIEYSDGRSEVLKPYPSGGVALTEHSPDGTSSCAAWYPEGHVFSDDERKAALIAYANRLGVSLPHTKGKSTQNASACSATAALAAAPAPASTLTLSHAPHPLPKPLKQSDAVTVPANFASNGVPSGATASTPQAVYVRTSEVHLIDQPKPPPPPAAAGQNVRLADIAPTQMPGAVAAAAAPPPIAAIPPAGSPYQSDAPDSGASNCLTVGSDGTHWGFRNQCNYAVQFVYCLKGAEEVLASCKDGTIAGSAAPNSFSALVADSSMKEQNVDHQFRWVACGGGAGEVVPKLDSIEPPSGRCLRRATAQN